MLVEADLEEARYRGKFSFLAEGCAMDDVRCMSCHLNTAELCVQA